MGCNEVDVVSPTQPNPGAPGGEELPIKDKYIPLFDS
jgi:hypothetical protein